MLLGRVSEHSSKLVKDVTSIFWGLTSKLWLFEIILKVVVQVLSWLSSANFAVSTWHFNKYVVDPLVTVFILVLRGSFKSNVSLSSRGVWVEPLRIFLKSSDLCKHTCFNSFEIASLVWASNFDMLVILLLMISVMSLLIVRFFAPAQRKIFLMCVLLHWRPWAATVRGQRGHGPPLFISTNHFLARFYPIFWYFQFL